MTKLTTYGFYYFWFTFVDPLSLLFTAWGLLVKPEFMLQGLVPQYISSYDPHQAFLFHHVAAGYTFIAIILGGVLRVTADRRVWKIVIAGVLQVDLFVLASMYVSLKTQDRFEFSRWRWQEWGNLLYTGGVAALRCSFLASYRNTNRAKQ